MQKKSLAQNLYLSNLVNKQFVVDLYPMIDFQLVDSARKKLSKIKKLSSKVRIKNLKDLENSVFTISLHIMLLKFIYLISL